MLIDCLYFPYIFAYRLLTFGFYVGAAGPKIVFLLLCPSLLIRAQKLVSTLVVLLGGAWRQTTFY